jgi:uncharacterized protein
MHRSELIFYFLQYSFIVFAVVCITIYFFNHSKLNLPSAFFKTSFIFILAGSLLLLDMYVIEPNWIRTERVVIHDPALAEVIEGIRVVQISDIHLSKSGFREKKLISKVNELRPDILFITGDFFHNQEGQNIDSQMKALTEVIRSFKVSIGIYGVPGNYDNVLLRKPELLKELKNAEMEILLDENRKIVFPNGKSLWLAGSRYSSYRHNVSSLTKALATVSPGAPVILLNHYPDVFSRAVTAGVNLVLAGHTHGGQIGIPFLVHLSEYASKSEYISGLFHGGGTTLYVNRGIGTADFPVRFLCRPEITALDIER